MNRPSFCLLASCLLLLALGPNAWGAIMDGDLVTIGRSSATDNSTGEYNNADPTYGGTLQGGEFRVTGGSEMFKTFCLEYSEHISLNGTYLATIDGGAIQGGLSGANPAYFDAPSGATQWLYAAYRTSTLDDQISGFAYDDGNWADALQLVFWRLEGELPASATDWAYTSNTTILAHADSLWAFYTENQDWLDDYTSSGVAVLNLWDKSVDDDASKPLYNATEETYALLAAGGSDATSVALRASLGSYKQQSQLYYSGDPLAAPPTPPVVPEPTSLAAWGSFAAFGFIAARRRRKTAAAGK